MTLIMLPAIHNSTRQHTISMNARYLFPTQVDKSSQFVNITRFMYCHTTTTHTRWRIQVLPSLRFIFVLHEWLFPTPPEQIASRHYDSIYIDFRTDNRVVLWMYSLSVLNHYPCNHAVYASQEYVAVSHARLASNAAAHVLLGGRLQSAK